jgi:hypothetical protein
MIELVNAAPLDGREFDCHSRKAGNMQGVDAQTGWTCKRERRGWRGRSEVVLGALAIMAASCLAAGFITGRMTAGPPAGNVTAHLGRAGDSEIPTAAPATASSVAFKKQPERDTNPASAAALPSVVILNPGTADAPTQEDQDSAPITRVRDSSKLRSEIRDPELRDKRPPAVPDRTSSRGDDRRDAESSTKRDYRALRKYMLNR